MENKYQEALNRVRGFCDKNEVWGCDIEENDDNLDTLQECVNRETPMKVIEPNDIIGARVFGRSYRCPNCKRGLPTTFFENNLAYCQRCGQRLDWEGIKENE